MNKKILIALLCMASALCTLAQVKIMGKVVDESGQPIEFATVRVVGTQVGVNTDNKGFYELSVAQRDTIVVEFTCVGYASVKRQLVKPTGTITINPKLYEKSHELTELQVTEYKKQTNTMQGIDVESIRLTPDASGGSVESVLTTMAGVSTKNEMSSQYMVRGGSYDENSVYINGIEVYRPQLISNGQQEGLSIINPDMVKSVNFSTGGFNAEYGDKMSSVLDITYREPQSFEGSIAASLQGGSLSLGQSSSKFSQLHGFRYKRNSSLLGSLESKGEYDPQYFDYQTHIVYKPTDKFRVSFLGNIAINDYRFTPVNRETSFGTSTAAKSFTVYFDGYEKDKFHTYFGALSLNYRVNNGTDLTLQASGYRTDELVSYDIHGEYWLDEAGTSGEGGIGGELGVGKYHEHERTRLKLNVYDISLKGNTGLNNHNLSYGVSMRRESIYDRSREWQWRDSAGYSLPHIPNEVNVIYSQSSSHDLNTTRFAAYVQDTYKLMTDRGLWSINGGVRVSHWDFNKEFLVSPRFSIGFVPERNNRLSLRLAGGLYYQAPFYKEYRMERVDSLGNAYIDLNHKIKSQRSIHAIIGGDYTFRALNRPFKFTTEVYYKNLANLIPYEVDNLKVVYSGLNESKGFIAGIDMKLFGQFVEGTDSWISFSLMKTQEELNGVKVPRPTDQRYSLAVFFTDYFPKLPRLKFSLKAIVSDGLPTTSPRMTRDEAYFRQPAYKRVDVGLSFQLVGGEHRPQTGFLSHFKSIWLGVDVFNLFDISNVSSYYWVTDVNNMQYAVPNYLTRRQINARLQATF
ncbi:MAG: carboxypeptidase-like regulatory domain-containing protein [Muribaculaceae bacterium]|nr:carboxypeptidase-like regulatory domain-containing protein [Muribaculaceae bacterium]